MEYVNIMTLLDDATRTVSKIKSNDYLSEGQFPIVDQGNNYICGYSNNEDLKISSENPSIIFGDHTCIIKYIDFKCYIGADGVKYLKQKTKDDCKYIYYMLKYRNVESTGYNRHFKYFKELQIPLLPLPTQKKIVEVLDKAKMLIDKRKEQIKLLDELIQSTFYDMFGDPVSNVMGWETEEVINVCRNIFGGGTPSKNKPEYYIGDIPWVTPKDMKMIYIGDSIDHINDVAVENSSTKIIPVNSILMVIRSGILKRTLPVAINIKPITINQDMKAFIVNENKVASVYFMYYMIMSEKYILSKVRAVTADNIEFRQIKELLMPLPPIRLQNQFADKVKMIESQKQLMEQSLMEMENNFNGLMQRAFRGDDGPQ